MSLSILVVDDEPDVAELFRQRFRREVRQGLYVLHFAYSAEEALEKLDTGVRPQLIVILSDINMPGMTALNFCQGLRQHDRMFPSSIITAYGDEVSQRKAWKVAWRGY